MLHEHAVSDREEVGMLEDDDRAKEGGTDAPPPTELASEEEHAESPFAGSPAPAGAAGGSVWERVKGWFGR
jgi:hypothetical protein